MSCCWLGQMASLMAVPGLLPLHAHYHALQAYMHALPLTAGSNRCATNRTRSLVAFLCWQGQHWVLTGGCDRYATSAR